ncbi:MAG: hypothetical protein C0485_02750 [Pirellula sp.]|nr:hypothetical protein [Pirellula sp.]
MKKRLALLTALSMVMLGATNVQAQNLLTNGTLDATYDQEIVPAFFLPKPANWINVGSRSISGPYEDEMSSEPWAGPAPTPVTTGGIAGDDWAVFFKPFSGNVTDGAATGHLYQDVPATPGLRYKLTGWAGAEANFLAQGAEIALEFLDGGGVVVGGQVVNLLPTLTVDNGLNFDYKQYTASAVAPAAAVSVRSRASMIGATANPAGGGQAYVVDDFVLTAVPEPATLGLLGLGLVGLTVIRRRK